MSRIPVRKTYKLYIGGAFPRIESVLTYDAEVQDDGPASRPLAAIELAEALATSDVPGGVANLLTGNHAELAPVLASHMDVNAIDLCGADGDAPELERLAADNVKRVVCGRADVQSPWEIASFLELKTVWHPMGQ